MSTAAPSPRAATRQCGRNRSGGEWPCMDSTCQNASWIAELRSELLSFPAGKYDDQVDGLGLIGQLLDTISAGNNPQPAEAPKPNNGYRPYDFGGWRTNDWLVY